MKVGIDGVLLGVWASIGNATQILDIGTGTGLIALMIAQRSKALITAIDIEESAVLQAKENIENSPWFDRVGVKLASLQEFATSPVERFDVIVSNPPYFVNSLKPPVRNRTAARHADSLTHEELIVYSIKLLNPTGRICLILPVAEGMKCAEFAKSKGLYCSRKVNVYPKPNVEAKRLLLEFKLEEAETTVSELVIEIERHCYSPEFTALAKDFYLKL